MQIKLGAFSKVGAIAIAAVITLSGCSAIRNAQNGFHQGFRQGFEKSYLQACEAHPGLKDYCVCTYDYISKKYSDDDLMKMTTTDTDTMKSAIDQAAHACVAKLPKGTTIQ